MRFVAAIAAVLLSGAAHAYPDKPVKYIIPFAPGGESDITARLQAVVFAAKYKQQMVVLNRPGAGGALVWSTLNGMGTDGHIVAGVNLPHIFLQPLEGNVNYKTEDVAPVLLPVHRRRDRGARLGLFKTYQDFLSAAKASLGKVPRRSGTYSATMARAAEQARRHQDDLRASRAPATGFVGTGRPRQRR
jgi:tripartite-type tricarboxylate transporter receptor subunit TctC